MINLANTRDSVVVTTLNYSVVKTARHKFEQFRFFFINKIPRAIYTEWKYNKIHRHIQFPRETIIRITKIHQNSKLFESKNINRKNRDNALPDGNV